jgi:lipopolysaccharide/colanic/teichoic acid biosynthesis glycosyltransferase
VDTLQLVGTEPMPLRRHAGWGAWRWFDRRRDLILGPAAGAAVVALLVPEDAPLRSVPLAVAALAMGAGLVRRVSAQAALLPLTRRIYPMLGPLLGVAILAALAVLTGMPHAEPLDLLAVVGASCFAAQPWAGLLGSPSPGTRRAAFIGSPAAAQRLAVALDAAGSCQYRVIGRVRCPGERSGRGGPPALGDLDDLGALVVEHDVDVLVMGADAPRLAAFGAMADSCLDLPVRLVELSVLFEEVFGHVPTAEINAAWFQCLADPDVRISTGPLKRALDVAGAVTVLVLTAPLLAVLVALVRRDGGPGLFSQVRIGEGGRPFRMHKLRTMKVGAGDSAQWASPGDPRITRIGAFLRRTHLDELPQLLEVVRGEMTLVGPRPEQPEFVDRLERMLPFYQRRHLMRPGITGWAQIRCGYAGSDVGSAWKLCHDLYYVKHRSFGVDLLILAETLATLFFEREPVMRPEGVSFVLADERTI